MNKLIELLFILTLLFMTSVNALSDVGIFIWITNGNSASSSVRSRANEYYYEGKTKEELSWYSSLTLNEVIKEIEREHKGEKFDTKTMQWEKEDD